MKMANDRYANMAGALAIFASLGAAFVNAQDRRGPPREPPAEALQACVNRARGDACTVETPRGDTISGTCGAPEGRALACMPEHGPGGPGGHHGGPPPAALDACRDISAGDACLVDTPDGSLEGTCAEVRAGTACIPNHLPHHD